MKCPECVAGGQSSKVFVGAGSVTAMYCPPFYDEEGRYHYHDMNTHATEMSCSNGHHWVFSTQADCWCGWPEASSGSESGEQG